MSKIIPLLTNDQVSCERFLVRLEKRNFNIFSPDLVSHLPFHGLVLVWRYLNYTLIKC